MAVPLWGTLCSGAMRTNTIRSMKDRSADHLSEGCRRFETLSSFSFVCVHCSPRVLGEI